MFRTLTAAFMLLSFGTQEIELDAPKQGPSVSTLKPASIFFDVIAGEVRLELRAWNKPVGNWLECGDDPACVKKSSLSGEDAEEVLGWLKQAKVGQEQLLPKVMRFLQVEGYLEAGTVSDEAPPPSS